MTVNYLKLIREASLIVYIGSFIHSKQIWDSFSLKKGSPSCLASIGNCWMTDVFILQLFSFESSSRLGTIDCCRSVIPITWLRSSSRLNKFSLTSEDSSRSSNRKMGRMCWLVFAFPRIGHRERMFSASAHRTYTKLSFYRSVKQGTIFWRMLC